MVIIKHLHCEVENNCIYFKYLLHNQNIAVHLSNNHSLINHSVMDIEQYITQQVEKGFIAMVKIEMLLSGKSFEESKKLVKQALKEQGLM